MFNFTSYASKLVDVQALGTYNIGQFLYYLIPILYDMYTYIQTSIYIQIIIYSV